MTDLNLSFGKKEVISARNQNRYPYSDQVKGILGVPNHARFESIDVNLALCIRGK